MVRCWSTASISDGDGSSARATEAAPCTSNENKMAPRRTHLPRCSMVMAAPYSAAGWLLGSSEG